METPATFDSGYQNCLPNTYYPDTGSAPTCLPPLTQARGIQYSFNLLPESAATLSIVYPGGRHWLWYGPDT